MADQKIDKPYQDISDYLSGMGKWLNIPVSEKEQSELNSALEEASEDQKKALKKKQRALEDAQLQFFKNFSNNCLKLKRFVEDKKLKAETVDATI